jgi:hypothetical protein
MGVPVRETNKNSDLATEKLLLELPDQTTALY